MQSIHDMKYGREIQVFNCIYVCSYYTLVMWYPGLFPRHDFFHLIPLFPSGDYVCDYGYFNDKSYTGIPIIIDCTI